MSIQARRGPEFERWRRANVAAYLDPKLVAVLDNAGVFGGPVVDEPPRSE